MWRISWRGVREHPVRFLLSVIAVVLGISFVTGTFALRTSLADTFTAIAGASYTADVYVSLDSSSSASGTTGFSQTGLPISTATTIAGVSGVRSADASLTSRGVLVGSDGTAVSSNGAPTLFTVITDAWGTNATVLQGRLPQNTGEIALEKGAFEASGLAVGDTATIVVGGSVRTVTVVGEWKYSEALFGALFVAMDSTDGTAALAPDGTARTIGVTLNQGANVDATMSAIASAIGTSVTARGGDWGGYTSTGSNGAVYDIRTGADMRAAAAQTVESVLGFVSIFLFVFAAVALFIGAFLISNTFTMSVRQRMREFAVLRAIGASPAQVFSSVIIQAAIVGIVGGLLGVLGGWGLISLVQAIFASMGAALASDAPVTPDAIVVALVVALVVSIVAAAIPARRAALVPPVAAMREKDAPERSVLVRGIVGGLLVAGGVAAVVWSAVAGEGYGPLLGLGATVLLLGALFVAPVLVPWLLGSLHGLFRLISQPIGPLAVSNVTRNPRRTASTASALMIGMALVGAATVLAASTQASLSDAITQSAKSDYVLPGQLGTVPSGAADAIAAVPGIAHTDVVTGGSVSVDGAAATVVSASDGTWSRSLILPTVQGNLATAIAADEVGISKTAATDWGIGIGDTISMTTLATSNYSLSSASASAATTAVPTEGGEKSITVTVGAIVSDNAIVSAEIYAPSASYSAVVTSTASTDQLVLVTAASGTDLSTLRTDLAAAVKPYYVISVLTAAEWTGQFAAQVNQVLYILYALLGISIVIAILGIVNTLALSVIERVREIGLMRAVGMGRLQLAGTIVVESVLIAVFGAALGLAIGVGVASALPPILANSGLGTLSIPWATLGIMLGISAIVGVLAALWPAARAARLPVLEAISSGE